MDFPRSGSPASHKEEVRQRRPMLLTPFPWSHPQMLYLARSFLLRIALHARGLQSVCRDSKQFLVSVCGSDCGKDFRMPLCFSMMPSSSMLSSETQKPGHTLAECCPCLSVGEVLVSCRNKQPSAEFIKLPRTYGSPVALVKVQAWIQEVRGSMSLSRVPVETVHRSGLGSWPPTQPSPTQTLPS